MPAIFVVSAQVCAGGAGESLRSQGFALPALGALIGGALQGYVF